MNDEETRDNFALYSGYLLGALTDREFKATITERLSRNGLFRERLEWLAETLKGTTEEAKRRADRIKEIAHDRSPA